MSFKLSLKPIIILLAVTFHHASFSQEGQVELLTLDDCINIALESNIAVKRSQNNTLIAKSNRMQSMMNFLPELSAATNYDYTMGTFFDQSAFRQVSTTTNTSNPLIRSNLVLFNGFANQHLYKMREKELRAAEYGIEGSKLDVKANVMTAYLNVILGKENIKIAEERVKLLQAQLDREVKRESVGVGNMEAVYNFRSQVANEKLNLVRLINQLKSDKLQLVQVLQLDMQKEYDIVPQEFDDISGLMDIESYRDILAQSINFAPTVKQSMARHDASIYSFKRAKGQRLPTISAFGQYGSRYSSNGARNPENGAIEEDAPFFDQLKWNAYDYYSVSLNIPIFTRFQNTNNIQVAKLNMLNAELDVQEATMTMTNAVQKVYLDMVAAQSTYMAALENAEALEQSFAFVKKRYETGNTDFYTYLESLNNKNRGEIELINSKYSIVFRKRILDLYKGL